MVAVPAACQNNSLYLVFLYSADNALRWVNYQGSIVDHHDDLEGWSAIRYDDAQIGWIMEFGQEAA